MRSKSLLIGFLLLTLTVAAGAKDKDIVVTWPESGTPVYRFSFGKLREVGSSPGQHSYTMDVVAENVWGKRIPESQFTLYLFDKAKVRIGEGWMQLSDVGAGQVVKFQMDFSASGTPASLTIAPKRLPPELHAYLPAKTVSMTVNSVPQGATLKVDGKEAGLTPKMIVVGVGKHTLEFAREGFTPGTFPLEVGQDDVSGGMISFELGTASYDTIELRDGTTVIGDLEAVTPTSVRVRVGGQVQEIERNRVKRILLIERQPLPQS